MNKKGKILVCLFLFLSLITIILIFSVLPQESNPSLREENINSQKQNYYNQFATSTNLEIKSFPLTIKYSFPFIEHRFISLWADFIYNTKLMGKALQKLPQISFQNTNEWKQISLSLSQKSKKGQILINKISTLEFKKEIYTFIEKIKNKNAVFSQKLHTFISDIKTEIDRQEKEKEKIKQIKNFLAFTENLRRAFNEIVMQNQKLNQLLSQINGQIENKKFKTLSPLLSFTEKETQILEKKTRKFQNSLNSRKKIDFLSPMYKKLSDSGNKLSIHIYKYVYQLNKILEAQKENLKNRETSSLEIIKMISQQKELAQKIEKDFANFSKEFSQKINPSLFTPNQEKSVKLLQNRFKEVHSSFEELIKSINSFHKKL